VGSAVRRGVRDPGAGAVLCGLVVGKIIVVKSEYFGDIIVVVVICYEDFSLTF
jgi:hypothetical protein